MPCVLLANLAQETCSFVQSRHTLEDFRRYYLYTGQEILDKLGGGGMEISGIIAAAADGHAAKECDSGNLRGEPGALRLSFLSGSEHRRRFVFLGMIWRLEKGWPSAGLLPNTASPSCLDIPFVFPRMLQRKWKRNEDAPFRLSVYHRQKAPKGGLHE